MTDRQLASTRNEGPSTNSGKIDVSEKSQKLGQMEDKKPRLNGWKRIGIVASVFWIVGAGAYTLKTRDDADQEAAATIYRNCASTRDEIEHSQDVECGRQSERGPMIDIPTAFQKCMSAFKEEHPELDCSKRSEDFAVGTLSGDWMDAAIVGIAPVPFGWGFVYLILFLVRWIKRGFGVKEIAT